ncbi:MAG: beta-lactamase family protein [Gemmatimonadaceae bacterium]|nr:beta-lactamase family protein [Chitinophagaceae bacterium]
MFPVKTTFKIVTFAFIGFLSCQAPAEKQIAAVKEDSLAFYPKTPEKLPKAEFRKYFNACKGFFDSMLFKGNFNGSVLVAKNGSIIFEKYVGYSNPVKEEDSLNEHSAFHLASVSKTFTAMAVLKLWEQGRLTLDDSLETFFPGFPYKGVTVKMLLNHRSGLPNYVHYLEMNGWDKKKMVTNEDVLSSLYTMHPPLQFTTGKRFAYCNTNYALLALIIEKVTAKKYGDYLKETFFTPLQMNDTYAYSPEDAERAMPSFEWNNREYGVEFLDNVYGDKNIYSTVRDMLKWDQALYPGLLFKQQTLDSAFAGYSFEKQGKRNYGLGWRMTFIDNGKKVLYHNGWWHGNNTVFIRLLDEQTTVIVLGNRFNRRIYSTRKICDVFGDYMQTTKNTEEAE